MIIKDVPLHLQKLYKRRPGLKAAGAKINFSQEQVDEYVRCSKDPIYFIKNYCKIVHIDRGVIPFALYPYQEEFINIINNNSKTVLCTARQVGKTITVAAYFIWYSIFHPNKDSAILANKGKTSMEIMYKIQNIYSQIPYWLQPGLVEWNKSSMVLENGSRIFCETTSADSIRGFSISHILLDEFAFVDSNKANQFFTSVYPTLSSGANTKTIIVSTPNGLNHFYKLFTDANLIGKAWNGFKSFMVRWDSVPGRDEKWAADQRRVLGDAMFCQEHEADFQGSSNTLISSYYIKKMVYNTPLHSADGFDLLIKPVKDHIYFVTVDTSRGVGNDYSAFVVFDATEIQYQIVAKYRSDRIPPILFPTIIHTVAVDFNNAYILVETNDLGEQVAGILYNDLEYEKMIFCDKERISEWGRGGAVGIKTTTKTKRIGCAGLKTLIESDSLLVNDWDIITEISTFIQLRNLFAADSDCHDDLVMCLILFGWLANTQFFKDVTNVDMRKMIFAAEALRLENEIIPFGFILDGSDATVTVEPVIISPTEIWCPGSESYDNFVYENYAKTF